MKGIDIPKYVIYFIICLLPLIILLALMTGKGQLAFDFLNNIVSVFFSLTKGAMSSLLFT